MVEIEVASSDRGFDDVAARATRFVMFSIVELVDDAENLAQC